MRGGFPCQLAICGEPLLVLPGLAQWALLLIFANTNATARKQSLGDFFADKRDKTRI
jgi:hypothetical protein